MSKDHRNFGLDVMRAIAILLVVFAHYFATTPLGLGGYCDVEIFFVLSGFLIGNILIRSFQSQGATVPSLRGFCTCLSSWRSKVALAGATRPLSLSSWCGW